MSIVVRTDCKMVAIPYSFLCYAFQCISIRHFPNPKYNNNMNIFVNKIINYRLLAMQKIGDSTMRGYKKCEI